MAFLMKSRLLFFFILFVVSLPISTLGANSSLLYIQCDFTQTGRIPPSNIGNLLIDMAAQSALHGFAISNFGGSSFNAVYGVARCDGDMSHEACSSCITQTEQDILVICPGSGAVRAWRQKCYLHYDITNFIGKWDQTYAAVGSSSWIAEDPKAFEKRVAELMGQVMAAAARETLKFKSGESFPKGMAQCTHESNLTIHGMAQCTQDLCESKCKQCLESSLETMTKYCGGSVGCHIYGSSCVLRYEIYQFLWLGDDAGI